MTTPKSKRLKAIAIALAAGISIVPQAAADQKRALVQYLDNGYLTEGSVEALRKEQKRVHAISAYEYALPVNGFMQWTRGHLAEAEFGDWVFYDTHKQKLPILTSNSTTPYTTSIIDLAKTPYYLELPAARIGGGVLDIYQRPTADLGVIGPDKGKGGKYIIVGPNHKVPAFHDADWVILSPSNYAFVGTRLIGYTPEETDKLRKQHFLYPVGADKSGQKFIQSKGIDDTWEQTRGLDYWKDTFEILKNEPVVDINRVILTQLRSLGITKSKGFQPNAEQIKILEDAAAIGEGIAMVNTFSKKSYKSRHWPDRNWRYILNQTRLDLNPADYYEMKEIASYTYEAWSTTKAMVMDIPNQGSKYLGAYVDDNEKWLDGSNVYQIEIPKNAPAADFWSITIYDAKTRTLIQNQLGDATVGSRDKSLKVEKDGSVKLYTGPKAPAGYENNWVQTNVGKGFFVYLRLYGPTTAYFDKSWKMPDIKKVK